MKKLFGLSVFVIASLVMLFMSCKKEKIESPQSKDQVVQENSTLEKSINHNNAVNNALIEIYSSSDHFNDMAVAPDGSVYAVGQKIVVIKNGQTLEYVAPSPLFSVFPVSANEAWAVGNSLILHYDGVNWTSKSVPCAGVLCRVWGYDGQIFITGGVGIVGYSGHVGFILQLVNDNFVKKAELVDASFLGMNAYNGSNQLYIAGSYMSPADHVERPALFVFSNNSIEKVNEIFEYNNGNSGNRLEKTPSGSFLMSTTDHYYFGNDLYLIGAGINYVRTPYNGSSRSLSSDGDKLLMANENGVRMTYKNNLNGNSTVIIASQNCFDVEYINHKIYILAMANGQWKIKTLNY